MTLHVMCKKCKRIHTIFANIKDIKEWKNGLLIQHAMPYLTAQDIELLTHYKCISCEVTTNSIA